MPTEYFPGKPNLIYIGDPMCAWCYGFHPEIISLIQHYRERVNLELVMGGLHRENKEAVNEQFRVFLINHWREISRKTGCTFSFDVLRREGFIYNTTQACRAVVTAGMISNNGFEYFRKLQEAFFISNRDTTTEDTFLEIAYETGINLEQFTSVYRDELSNEKTKEHFSIAASLNARVYPTVLLRIGSKIKLIACGYTERERMHGIVEHELKAVQST